MTRITTTTTLPAKATKTTKKAPAIKPPTKPLVQPKSEGKAKPVATKSKEPKLCLTGSGQTCTKEFAGLGADARYKSRLINIATHNEPTDLPTKEQLVKLGYTEDRIRLVPHKGMTPMQATTIIADRQWLSHLDKRKAKLEKKGTKTSEPTKTKAKK